MAVIFDPMPYTVFVGEARSGYPRTALLVFFTNKAVWCDWVSWVKNVNEAAILAP